MKKVRNVGARHRAENKGEGWKKRTPASEPQGKLTNLRNLRKPGPLRSPESAYSTSDEVSSPQSHPCSS